MLRALFQSLPPLEAFLTEFHKINENLWRQVEEGKIPPSIVGYTCFQKMADIYGFSFKFEISGFYEAELVENSTWIDGAVDLLEHLKAKNFKIGLISNGFAHVQRRKFRNHGFSKYSDVLVIAEEIGSAKPHPQIFNHALKIMGATPETTLMVGDSLSSDGEGAKKVGLKFCWYNPNRTINPMAWQPDYTIHHLSHLLI